MKISEEDDQFPWKVVLGIVLTLLTLSTAKALREYQEGTLRDGELLLAILASVFLGFYALAVYLWKIRKKPDN